MLRYQRLGYFDMKEMNFSWECIEKSIPEMGKLRPNHGFGLYTDMEVCYNILFYEHMETKHPFGPTIPYALKGIELGYEYFYGKWRDSFQRFYYSPVLTREETRHETSWVNEITYCFLFSLLMNDVNSLLSFVDWIGDDLYADLFDSQYTAYWKVLAYALKNNTLTECESHKREIENSSRRIYKFLLACLEAILNQDVKLFETTFIKYMKLYIKQVTDPKKKNSKYSYYYMSLDGSILYNYAHNTLKLELPIFTEEIMDRILTSESCGLLKMDGEDDK